MKRIKAACLEQTIQFLMRDGGSSEWEKKQLRQEYESYKLQLERRGTKYRILEETVAPDGSITIRIKKQNSGQPVGNYLD